MAGGESGSSGFPSSTQTVAKRKLVGRSEPAAEDSLIAALHTIRFAADPRLKDRATTLSRAVADQVSGFVSVIIGDADSGALIVSGGKAESKRARRAAKAIAAVYRSTRTHDQFEEMVSTLSGALLILLPFPNDPSAFVHLAVDRTRANIALVRLEIAEALRAIEDGEDGAFG